MRAVQLVRWQAEPELRDVPVPEPRPGEAVQHLVPLQSADMSVSKTHAQFQG